MDTVSYLNPPELHVNPAFTQAVRIPAGHDLVVIGGQNGVDESGRVVSDDIAGQTRQALRNCAANSRATKRARVLLPTPPFCEMTPITNVMPHLRRRMRDA